MRPPDPTPGHTPPGSPPATAYGRVDGCPECVTNVEPPWAVEGTANDYIAAYLCSDCGHRWTTSWKER